MLVDEVRKLIDAELKRQEELFYDLEGTIANERLEALRMSIGELQRIPDILATAEHFYQEFHRS